MSENFIPKIKEQNDVSGVERHRIETLRVSQGDHINMLNEHI